MASIKSIWIENFQSHVKTKVDLAPDGQLTVIVGPSDSGKTAVIRALRWILYNVPQGMDFVRAGCGSVAVAVTYDDGTKVVRERSKATNRYRICRPGAEDAVFEGFGNDVPLEVQEITGVRPVTIGDLALNLNLSEQLDGPFLGKSISSGARAKVLGKLAGTEEVDHAAKTLNTDLYRAGQDEKRLAAEIEALDAQIAEYGWLPEMAGRIVALNALLASIKDAQERATALEGLRTRLESVRTQAATAQAVVDRWRNIDLVDLAAANVERDITLGANLVRIKGRRKELAEAISGATLTLVRWANLERMVEIVTGAESATNLATRLHTLMARTAQVHSGQSSAQAQITRWADLDRASEIATTAETTAGRGQQIIDLRNRRRSLLQAIDTAGRAAARWARLDTAVQLAESVEVAAGRATALIAHRGRITEVRRSRVLVEDQLSAVTKMVGDAESQYSDALLQAGKCPLCGSTVNPELLKEAV